MSSFISSATVAPPITTPNPLKPKSNKLEGFNAELLRETILPFLSVKEVACYASINRTWQAAVYSPLVPNRSTLALFQAYRLAKGFQQNYTTLSAPTESYSISNTSYVIDQSMGPSASMKATKDVRCILSDGILSAYSTKETSSGTKNVTPLWQTPKRLKQTDFILDRYQVVAYSNGNPSSPSILSFDLQTGRIRGEIKISNGDNVVILAEPFLVIQGVKDIYGSSEYQIYHLPSQFLVGTLECPFASPPKSLQFKPNGLFLQFDNHQFHFAGMTPSPLSRFTHLSSLL